MADDQDFEMWDDEFLEKAIQATEAAVCSSSSNPTQPPPQQLFQQPQSVISISYSPPRELSQRVREENHKNIFDFPASFNGINQGLNSVPTFSYSSRLHDEDKCSKQQEITRLKEELGRVSKVLTNLEQECLELRKERDKNEIHLRSVLPQNGSKDAEASCTKKLKLKNKDSIEGLSVIDPAIKVSCKALGVQTDENSLSSDSVIKKNQPVTSLSQKLTGIWEQQSDQQPRNNLVFKLYLACESDLQALSECIDLNKPSEKTTSKLDCLKNNSLQAVEAAKVSHFYSILAKISYDMGRLEDLLEALLDLCRLQNKILVQRSLRVLHVALKHISSMENRSCSRDKNVIMKDPSTVNRSSERHDLLFGNNTETSNPALTKLTSGKKVRNDESSPLIPSSKWFTIYQSMQQVVTKHSEEIVRVEAVSIMNFLLLRTDAYSDREM